MENVQAGIQLKFISLGLGKLAKTQDMVNSLFENSLDISFIVF